MQSEDPSVCPSDPVESVTVRLGQLEITLSVRRLSPASGSSSFAPTPLPLGFLHSKHQLQLQLPQQGQVGIVLKGLGIQKLWFRVLWLLEVQHPLHDCLCLICITFIVGFEAQIVIGLQQSIQSGCDCPASPGR